MNEEKFNVFVNEQDVAIVVTYEEWCGYSKKALRIFNDFKKNLKFKELEIPIGFLDVHGLNDFKAYNNITKFPIIDLYIKQVKLTYNGLLSEAFLLDWIREKVQTNNIPQISDVNEIETILKEQKDFIYYHGDSQNPRFKIFAEGHYHFSQLKFYYGNSPYVKEEYGFVDNSIYIYKTGKGFSKYLKAFKQTRYLNWIAL